MDQAFIEGFRLSPQQRRLWLSQEPPGTPAQAAFLLAGELDRGALRRALEGVVARHEILRTTYRCLSGMDLPIQVVGEPRLAWRELPRDGGGEEAVRRLLAEERALPSLEEDGTLVRCSLLPVGERENLLAVTLPPAGADDRSLCNLLGEIAEAYAAGMTGEPGREEDDGPVQYVDFSEWQNGLLEEEGAEARREFWRRQGRLPEPAGRRLRHGCTEAESAVRRRLDPELTREISTLAASQGVLLSTVLLAAWNLLLARLLSAPDLTVGCLADGRRFDQLSAALGLFARYLPVAVAVQPDFTVSELLVSIQSTVEEAERHQEYFLWEDYQGEEGGSFPALFDFVESPAALTRGEVSFALAERRVGFEPADLRLSAWRDGRELRLELLSRPGLLSTAEAGRWLARYKATLRGMVRQPGRPVAGLDLLDEEERLLLARWSRTGEGPLPDLPAHRLFERQAALTPEAPAMLAEDGELTFAELDRRASRLACFLSRRGLGIGGLLGIVLGRSADQIVALLAAWKAGAAFVPLDPAQPRQRLQGMIEDLAASAPAGVVVLTRRTLRDRVTAGSVAPVVEIDAEAAAIEREPASPLTVSEPDLPAYWIFTSGSTGRPKGTIIRHRSVVNLAAALDRAIYSYHRDASPLRVSVNAPLVFDASIKQIVQLLAGHALCLVPEEVRRDGEALLAFLRRRRVDVLDCTPSQLGLLLDAGLLAGAGGPRAVLVGGEAIGRELWETLAGQERIAFYDVYGPTECTVDTTAERIAPGAGPNIGRPLHNVRVHLLDGDLRRTPAGMPGEICIGGAGLALGYAGRPELTAERFVPDPFAEAPGERLYRSGDLARHLEDGRVEYLGRLDHQVKVRGYRVELGEIEAALAGHPGVRSAVVIAREDQAGSPRLAAYVVPRSAPPAQLQGRARHALPNGMAVFALDRTETDYIFQEIFEDRLYLRHGIELREDATVFDVGANIGLFSLFVRQEAPRARIFAFEPIPPVFEALRANVDSYRSDVRLFPYGLSDRDETVEFTYYPHFSSRSGLAAYADRDNELEVTRRHLRNTWDEVASGGFGGEMEGVLDGKFVSETVPARVRPLSDVLREERVERVDLLKIDVQRAELDVLRGIDDEVWRRIEQVVMEVHDEPGGPTEGRVAEITELLERHGFQVVSEQDEALRGTDRHSLFASRRGLSSCTAEVRGSVAPAPSVAAAGELTLTQLQAYLAERLPEPMIPADLVFLDELPYNRNGKIDRQALPAPEELRSERERPRLEPRTPVEEILAVLFAEVLGSGAVGADESFFELGGHSLLATQLVSRVRETFRVELPLRTLFESPSVRELAATVERALQAGRDLAIPPIEPVPGGGDTPLSFAQESLWFLHQLDPESASYNSGWALEVRGPLDPGALAAALSEIVRRHEVLRTTFTAVAGRPVQRVMPPFPVRLERDDLSPLPEPRRSEEARRRVREELRRPFDLEAGPLVRGALLRMGEEEHLLVLGIHHIACDGWSLTVMQRELAALYPAFRDGRPSPLPELPLQYSDFARWQRRWMQGRVLEDQLGYWKARLVGAPAEIELPREADPVWSESRRTFVLPVELGEGLNGLARRCGATLYMTLLTAFGVLLARSSEQEDLVVGTAVAGRDRAEIEGLIGLFINMLPIRLDLSGGPRFTDLLARVREATLEAYMHQGLPFEKLVGELPQVRSSGRNPLFQVAFGLQNLPWQTMEFAGLTLVPWEVGHDEVRLDLTLWMSESPEGLRASWTWNPALFHPETIARWQARLHRLLAAAVDGPETGILDFDMLSEEERREIDARKARRESSNLARLRGTQRRSLGAG